MSVWIPLGSPIVGGAGATGPSGPSGAPGATGPSGPAGARGSRLYAGDGAPDVVDPTEWTPDGTDAADGDFYFNTAINQWYELGA